MFKKSKPYDPNWQEKEAAAAARKAEKEAENTRKILERKAQREATLAAEKKAEDEQKMKAVRSMAMEEQAKALIDNARYPPNDDRFGKGAEAREHLRQRRLYSFPAKELRKAIYKRMKRIYGGTHEDNTELRAVIERIAHDLKLNLDKLEEDLFIGPVVKQPAQAGPSTITPQNPPLPVPADTPQKGLTPAEEAARDAARAKRIEDREKMEPSPWDIPKDEREMADKLNVIIGTPAP
ncbi:hypothetical protein N9S30_00600 [bacterium]|nr:hypothetical protein [bacterium]